MNTRGRGYKKHLAKKVVSTVQSLTDTLRWGGRMSMSQITEAELARLRATKNEDEWNVVCDDIKKAHGGFPEDWWPKVKLSGLMAEVTASWGRPELAEVRILSFEALTLSPNQRVNTELANSTCELVARGVLREPIK